MVATISNHYISAGVKNSFKENESCKQTLMRNEYLSSFLSVNEVEADSSGRPCHEIMTIFIDNFLLSMAFSIMMIK